MAAQRPGAAGYNDLPEAVIGGVDNPVGLMPVPEYSNT
jgi:hypothetical protein